MANWFKVDANIFEDPKVKYCIHRVPPSFTVFIWCLCQCCRERSDRFEWQNIEAEIVGLSLLIHVTPEVIQSSLTVLCEATLIGMRDNTIIVTRWSRHQSDYMNRKEYFSRRYEEKNSTVKHSEKCEYPLRGEERRGDKSISIAPVELKLEGESKVSVGIPPPRELLLEYGKILGLTPDDVDAFMDHHTAGGWILGNRQKMKDWKAALRTWKRNKLKFNQTNAKNNGHGKPGSPNRNAGTYNDQPADYSKLVRRAVQSVPDAQ